MKIGIDARFLTHPQHGGFKTYTGALVSSLAQVDRENSYIIYTDRIPEKPLGLPANFKVKAVSGEAVFREQILLPIAMIGDRVDVAHFLCNTAPVAFGLKMVLTIHDTIPLRPSKNKSRMNMKQRLLQFYWRKFMVMSARRAALAITNSEYVRDDIRMTMGLSESSIWLAPMPIDPAFSLSAKGTRPDGVGKQTTYVLAFASPDGRKNHEGAIQAYRSAAVDYPNLNLILVCSHPDVRETLERETNSGTQAVGPVSTQELVWLFRNASALLFPSFDEGFGLPPLEAMACGTPVVASNAGALLELLGGCAIQVEPTDVSGLAEGLRRVLSNPELRNNMSRKGLEQVSNFTPENMGRQLIKAYEAVM